MLSHTEMRFFFIRFHLFRHYNGQQRLINLIFFFCAWAPLKFFSITFFDMPVGNLRYKLTLSYSRKKKSFWKKKNVFIPVDRIASFAFQNFFNLIYNFRNLGNEKLFFFFRSFYLPLVLRCKLGFFFVSSS